MDKFRVHTEKYFMNLVHLAKEQFGAQMRSASGLPE